MKCYVCDAVENFHSFDTTEKKMHQQRELLCCKGCGAVMYRVDAGAEEKMRDYYRFEYRPSPTHMNMLTTTHKLNYVKKFLGDFLKDKKDLVIADVGCATGYLPNFFRELGHKATGCEYTLTFRRFAENYYGIPISEELRTDVKYDLISIYHVLEHMIEPDKKLAYYASLLKDGGHMLISTPEWYDVLEDTSGPTVTSFEQVWHKDHINCFSETDLKNLFRKTGLEIVKEDRFVYGQSYLVKYTRNVAPIQSQTPTAMIKRTLEGKEAIDLYAKGKLREALKIWPKFPDAWIRLLTEVHGKDPDEQLDLFDECFKVLPKNRRILTAYMTWHYTYQRYDEVLKVADIFMQVAPDEEKLLLMGYSYMLKGQPREAMDAFQQSCNMDPRKWQDCTDWICAEAAKLPTWDERALSQIKDSVEKTAKPKLKLLDPMFDKPEGHQNGQNTNQDQSTPQPVVEPEPNPAQV